MTDYEYIYSMAVQKALKPRIIGSIFCAIRDDVLNIIIENDGKKFEYSIDEITEKIRTGYPVDSVVRYCFYNLYNEEVIDMNYRQRETAREVRLWIGHVIVPAVVGITGLVTLHPELKDKAKIQVNRIKNKFKK